MLSILSKPLIDGFLADSGNVANEIERERILTHKIHQKGRTIRDASHHFASHYSMDSDGIISKPVGRVVNHVQGLINHKILHATDIMASIKEAVDKATPGLGFIDPLVDAKGNLIKAKLDIFEAGSGFVSVTISVLAQVFEDMLAIPFEYAESAAELVVAIIKGHNIFDYVDAIKDEATRQRMISSIGSLFEAWPSAVHNKDSVTRQIAASMSAIRSRITEIYPGGVVSYQTSTGEAVREILRLSEVMSVLPNSLFDVVEESRSAFAVSASLQRFRAARSVMLNHVGAGINEIRSHVEAVTRMMKPFLRFPHLVAEIGVDFLFSFLTVIELVTSGIVDVKAAAIDTILMVPQLKVDVMRQIVEEIRSYSVVGGTLETIERVLDAIDNIMGRWEALPETSRQLFSFQDWLQEIEINARNGIQRFKNE